MSAAATAAGYLYASGRLRGRGAREEDEKVSSAEKPRQKIRVAVYQKDEKPKAHRVPKIEYRTRRWRPE